MAYDDDTLVDAPARVTMTVKPQRLSADDISKRLRERGFSEAGAAGIVQNIKRESGFDPGNVGDGGTSYGLFQHHNERKTALEKFAKDAGKDASDPDVQIDFADHEMKTQYPKLRAQLAAETDPAKAEEAFRRVFERPKATGGYDSDPVVGTEGFKFSDYAMKQHAGKSGTDMVYMRPQDYLDLSPDFEGNPMEDRSAISLRQSAGKGEQIEAIPTLDLAVTGSSGKVTDQDGRHRALFAKEAGLDMIPVAVRRTGSRGPVTEIEGESGTILPYDFASVPEAAKPDGALMSAVKGASAGFGESVFGAQEAVGKGLSAVGADGVGTALTDDARERVAKEEGKLALNREAHPIATHVGEALGGAVIPALISSRIKGGPMMLGAVGGAIGGALQPASGDGLDYAVNKALQIGEGAVVGAGIGKGLELAARWLTPVLTPLVKFLTGVKGPEVVKDVATKEVMRRIAQDVKGGGPTAQDMLDLLAKTPGKPITLADVGGENLRGLAGRVSRSPGEARQIMNKFFEERDLDAGLRLASDVDRGIGASEAFDVRQALAESRAAAAQPAYEQAFAQPVTMAQVRPVQRIIGDPIGQEALQKGMRVVELEHLAQNRFFDPEKFGVTRSPQTGRWIVDPEVEGGKKLPSMRFLDAVKRGYDEIVEGFRDPTSGRLNLNQYGRAVNDVRAAYVGRLRETFPKYAAALDSWSGPSQSLDALKAGQDFLLRDPREIATRMKNLTPGDREFYKIGAASTLRKAIAKTGANGDEARKIVGNSYTRAQLRPLFEDDASYNRFIDSVMAESRMFRTGTKVLGNSATAARLAEDTSPESAAFMNAGHAAIQAKSGNWLGAAKNIGNAMAGLARSRDPALNADIARIFTATAPAGGPSPGMLLLRNFAQTMPATRDHLGRFNGQSLIPLIAPPVQQLTQPRIGQ